MRNILLLGYLIISTFLYILNFELFHTGFDFDFGFGIYITLPLLIIMIIGLIFCSFFYLLDRNKQNNSEALIEKLNSQIKIHQKDLEIINLKLKTSSSPDSIESIEETNTENYEKTPFTNSISSFYNRIFPSKRH